MYRDSIPVYTDGATVFPPNTVISMRLPNSASVFKLLKFGQLLKLYRLIFVSPIVYHMKLEYPLIGMVIRNVSF